MTPNYAHIIATQLPIREKQIAATIALLDDKATIPFIARYRKEQTGSLDEVQIADIKAQYERIQEMADRKDTILRTIEEQGKLTAELSKRIEECWSATELEDIYLPYKPHRKTRADIAIERGLEPLAEELLKQRGGDILAIAKRYITKDVPSTDEALQGARDIIAQRIASDEKARGAIRREFTYSARLTTKVVKAKQDEPEAQNYKDYFAVTEPLKRMSSHRLLAIRRAEQEGYIRVDISPDEEKALDKLAYLYLKSQNDASYQVELAMEDSYKRLLRPAIETEFAQESKRKADEEAIRVFAGNLRQLLLESPLGQKRVLALDPGFRTGCKTVVLTEQGDLVHHTVVYLHNSESMRTLTQLVSDYRIEAIAIGNGTASRECEEMTRLAIQSVAEDKRPEVYVVSENGASVYSASKIAREEFPEEDVTVRGAVSIGRRLIDPLAELVKIDPKSIGVGQYQHDVDQVKLRESLQQTVESVVNAVGVDVNTASRHLLTYISGLGPALAQNIVDYRAANGPFDTRQALKKVPKLGPKAFEQCAGFLRIAGGSNPLDNTAIHPESYALAKTLVGKTPDPATMTVTELDILHELDKPSRDPRTQKEVFRFDDSVHTIDDLQAGMVLPGIVTNISAFGAFVDLGVHKDGLIHISEMANRRVKDPQEVVHLHEHVRVRVIDIDRARGRIQLSLKDVAQ